MYYAVSDIHGCFDKYVKLLEMIRFSDEDTLYVLGDCVDRGEGGCDVLLDMFSRKNVIPMMGNHDYSALTMLSMIENTGSKIPEDKQRYLAYWLSDGGFPTCQAFRRLDEKKRGLLLSYIKTFSYVERVTAGGHVFHLSHTIPEIELFDEKEGFDIRYYINGEPDYEETYPGDVLYVTGHTPTGLIDEKSGGKIWRGNNHIAIDCGAVFGSPLGCICLDTLEEFYAG